ncbi:MAG: cytosine permease, partial [Chloroflexi bacterium]|nr:cytosine permease [Chloroflexota bacterium]
MAVDSVPVGPTQQVEADVPVREGDYGDRVMTVEPGGVEYIRLAERHGTPLRLFWTWNSPNWEFATMFLGVIPITVFGGGFL